MHVCGRSVLCNEIYFCIETHFSGWLSLRLVTLQSKERTFCVSQYLKSVVTIRVHECIQNCRQWSQKMFLWRKYAIFLECRLSFGIIVDPRNIRQERTKHEDFWNPLRSVLFSIILIFWGRVSVDWVWISCGRMWTLCVWVGCFLAVVAGCVLAGAWLDWACLDWLCLVWACLGFVFFWVGGLGVCVCVWERCVCGGGVWASFWFRAGCD